MNQPKKTSNRDVKSEGNIRPIRRRKKRGAEQTQDDATVAGAEIEDLGTARAPKTPAAKGKVQTRAGSKKRSTTVPFGNTATSTSTTAVASMARGGAVIPVDVDLAMADFVRTTLMKGIDSLRKEFAELKTYTAPDFKHTVFDENTSKNRYRDVVCLDATRVILTLNVPPESNYIHANYVKMEYFERQYIATQGPMEATIGDFWRMIYQENATSIVMLCKFVEYGKQKCGKYFPIAPGSYQNYGCMFINNKKVETTDDKTVVYTLEILPDGCSNSNLVKLFHMESWPDRGVPDRPMSVLRLMRQVPPGICVLHCSAGIGRTGTVIAIDACVQRLNKGHGVCIKDIFHQLRNQRASAVQTEAQYVFIHTCVLEYIRAKMPTKYKEAASNFADEVKKSNMV